MVQELHRIWRGDLCMAILDSQPTVRNGSAAVDDRGGVGGPTTQQL